MTPDQGSGSDGDEPIRAPWFAVGDAPLPPDEVPEGVRFDSGEDTSWVGAFGEVTRPSPPVGSLAIGIPGIGFDLVLPDGTIAESYGPDGRLLGPGELAVVNPPEITAEPDDEAPRAPEDGHAPEAG